MKKKILAIELSDNVFEAVREITGYTKKDICSSSRKREIVSARFSAVVIFDSLHYCCTEIGYLVNRDHSSVLNMLGKHELRMVQLKHYRYFHELITSRLDDSSFGYKTSYTNGKVYRKLLKRILDEGLTTENKLEAKILSETL